MHEVRLIDANALKSEMEIAPLYAADMYTACAVIDAAPTIEAESVRYGQWVNNVFCSECKRFPVDVSISISNQELTKYFSRCPHCGARMKNLEKSEYEHF